MDPGKGPGAYPRAQRSHAGLCRDWESAGWAIVQGWQMVRNANHCACGCVHARPAKRSPRRNRNFQPPIRVQRTDREDRLVGARVPAGTIGEILLG